MKSGHIVCLALVALYSFAAALTLHCIENRIGYESNPIMANAINIFGVRATLLACIITLFLISYAMIIFGKKDTKFASCVSVTLLITYAVDLANNLAVVLSFDFGGYVSTMAAHFTGLLLSIFVFYKKNVKPLSF